MEKSFNQRTPVLYQDPAHPLNYKNPKKSWILVPMCAYKVSVPYPKDNALNLFQETILKLLVSGSRNVSKANNPMSLNENEWIAKALCLKEELVEFIIKELQERKLIDERRRVTEMGFTMLREGSSSYEMATGYVFFNYVTKTYMDAFVPDHKYNEVDVEGQRGEKIRFDISKSAANPNRKTGVVVNVDTSAEMEPDAYEILNILKRHSKRTRKIGFTTEDGEEVVTLVDAEAAERELPERIKTVKFLGVKKDIYVATYMFMDSNDILNHSRLQVCYPFGEGVSPSLLDNVERLSHGNDNSALMDEILGLKESVNSLNEEELEKIRKGHKDTEKAIKDVLSDNIEKYPSVLSLLLSVEESYRLVKSLIEKNKGSNIEIIKEKMKDYVRNNYNLISSILIYTINSNDYFRECEISSYSNQNAVILTDYAKHIGFDDSEGSFERFFRIKKGTIKNSITEQHMSGLFAYNIVSAQNYLEHPFYRLAKEIPDLINYLLLLRDLRNDSSHGNDIMLNFNKLKSYRRKNMFIAYTLLDGLTFKDDKTFEDEDESNMLNNVKAVRKAADMCEKVYTNNYTRNTNVATQLRNLQYQVYIEGNDYPRCASEVFEALFKAIAPRRIDFGQADSVGDYQDEEDNRRLLAEMQKLGFEVSQVPYYSKSDVTITMRNYSRGTLMTLFYAWYFSEIGNGGALLSEVAKESPELIHLLSEIHENRKHVGKMQYKDERLKYTQKHIDGVVNKFIDTLTREGIL